MSLTMSPDWAKQQKGGGMPSYKEMMRKADKFFDEGVSKEMESTDPSLSKRKRAELRDRADALFDKAGKLYDKCINIYETLGRVE